MKFAFVDAEKASFPVTALCRVLNVTRQGYYASISRGLSPRAQQEVALHDRVRQIHVESRGTYGSPRVHKTLQSEGIACGKHRVARSMRNQGIKAREPRRFRITTVADAHYKHAPNTLDRDFSATKPNERWVTDITYIWTAEGWSYLSVILDLFSRRVVGWALGSTLETSLPLAALDMALSLRRPALGLLHHSDRGCQYTSAEYQLALRKRGIDVSMSRKGNCWDNAAAESFFSTIKTELVRRHTWTTRVELRAAVFDYIEVFYNRQRIHSSIGYKSPAQAEAEFAIGLVA